MGNRACRIRKGIKERGYVEREKVAYICRTCAKATITVRVDVGTVPADIGCRATRTCLGRADQSNQPVAADERPRWEWYRPDVASTQRLKADGGPLWKTISAGGLLLRQVGSRRT